MIYIIDFDKLQVKSKSENKKLLDKYVSDTLAVALIDSPDELILQFSIQEMRILRTNIGYDGNYYAEEDEEADAVWGALEKGQGDFPNFTDALGEKLVKDIGSIYSIKKGKNAPSKSPLFSSAASKSDPVKPDPVKPDPVRPSKTKGIRAKDLIGMTFTKGLNSPRKGTSFEIFTNFLEENLDEATFDELVKTFIENYVPKNPNKPVDESLGRAYVRDAFNGGYIEEGL